MTDEAPLQPAEVLPAGLYSVLNSKPSGCDGAMGLTPAELVRVLDSPQSIRDAPLVIPEIQDGVVAYIDALGSSALMYKVGNVDAGAAEARDVYLTTIGMAEEFQSSINELSKTVDGIKSMVISDSFVVAVPYSSDAICKLVEFLAKFQYKCLATYSQALRGAVSKGKVIGKIPENRIIGSAFIAAYSAEQKIAFFPRIVIDRYILEDAEIGLIEGAMPIATDKDGIRYVDFMKNEVPDQITAVVDAERQRHIDSPVVLQKWNWLKTFLEQKRNNRLNCCNSLS